jgi:uncharacterized protein (DUF2062 family)
MAFFKEKIVQPLLGFLKQGVTPKKMALTLSLGLVFGIFPVIGTTTLICTALALAFRLNMAIMQLANYLAYPLQIIFLIPFLTLGTKVFGSENKHFSLEQMLEMFGNDFWTALQSLGMSQLYAVLIWAFFSLPLGFLVYIILFQVFKRFEKR